MDWSLYDNELDDIKTERWAHIDCYTAPKLTLFQTSQVYSWAHIDCYTAPKLK